MTETVLVIAAHPDDEALGCGGTIARHAAERDEVYLLFVADGETSRIQAAKPNRNIEALAASKLLGARPPRFLDMKDQKLDLYTLLEVTQAIEAQISEILPTIVYTHHAYDLNLDHRIVHQAVMTALRPLERRSCEYIFTFEVPSSTEWGETFAPNHFVRIDGWFDKKMDALRCYDDEMRPFPHPRSYKAIEALAINRGAQSGLHKAEAFVVMRSLCR